jgi:hypothetical protein
MAKPRLIRSFSPLSASPFSRACAAILPAALALTLYACKSKESTPTPDNTPPAAPSGSTASTDGTDGTDDGYKPLHPGHVNQRDPKGGFMRPLTAPEPEHVTPLTASVIDSVPSEEKLAPTKDENGHCGEIELGGEKIPLDCMSDDYSTVPWAAKSMVSSEDLASARAPRKLPAVVDHRKDGTEGPILDQGKTSACTSFSLVTAANHAAARFLGHPGNLSPMHAWARYHTPKMSLADNDNVGKGLADLTDFAFDPKLANEWQHGTRVDASQLHKADREALVDITNITRLDGGSMNEIKSALASGQDIWFAIKAAHGLAHTKKNADGESNVPNFDWHSMPSSQHAGHALVLAGYEDTPHGTFYLIHNSWGTKWGTAGYAWIWEKTLRANIADAYVLQVRPTERAHSKHHPSDHKYASCSASLAPDATTAQCVPPCEDGGPRVNGVCPTVGQCPDGEVNLDGKCELSAPALNKTLSNGVKVKCGLSGCTYVVPTGTASCSIAKGCTVSCAAPRFMLGSGTRGLTCTG